MMAHRQITKFARNARLLLGLLTRRERRGLAGLAALMAVAGVVEVSSVLSIVPFLAVAANPDVIQQNEFVSWVYNSLGFASDRSFLVFFGAVLIAVLLLANGFQALITYLQLKFSGAVNTSVAVRLFEGYLAQPYEYYVERNSNDLQACVQAEAVYVQSAVLQPILQITQKAILIALLLLAVVAANPLIALIAFATCSGMYGAVFLFVRKRLKALGDAIGPANRGRFKAVSEAFGAPKLTKLMHLERFFSKAFATHASIVNQVEAKQQMLGQLPRYGLEAMSLGGIMAIAICLIAASSRFSEVIPLLGFYAFAGYRLMPAVQVVYKSVSHLQFGWSRVESVHREFQSFAKMAPDETGIENASVDHSGFDRQTAHPIVELRNVCFQYSTAAEQTLTDISLVIEANTTVGFCGTTGAGKTTLLDILLGLLEPESGEMLVDGACVNQTNRRQWQKQIGYVPQDIVLTDTSITQNIAFGVNPAKVNIDQVRRAARLAGILDFIDGSLPDGFETLVGERGVRLSGGQRQRIGIARALYHSPRIVMFDEATSSLDMKTEETVMSAIHGLAHKMTIVLVAHRIKTLEACDVIYRLDRGRLVQKGSYEELFRPFDREGQATMPQRIRTVA